MSNAVDMSLDDLIKKSKQSKSSRGRGGARTSSISAPGGPTRRNFKRKGNHSALYSTGKVQAPYGSSATAAAIETGTKLFISNLDYGVSTEDIKELFSEIGELKRYGVHYDRSGRSNGTADVVYARRVDALAAIKRYHNVQLDGQPMKIEIVGKNILTVAAAPAPNSARVNKNRSSGGRSGQGRGGARRSGLGARGGGRGRGDRGEKVSAQDLDAELEKYHSEAMQTN